MNNNGLNDEKDLADGEKMSHQYLVRYFVKSNFKMNEGNKFDFQDKTVIVHNSQKNPNTTCKWPNICFFDVTTFAENINLAIDDAFTLVDGVIGLISLNIAISSDIPILEKAIEWDDGIHDRCFVQNTIIPYNVSNAREFEPEKFSIIFPYLIREDIHFRNLHPGRMERALRWYRKGIEEFDVFSKHTCYWVGLEILNPIIKDKYLEQITTDLLRYYHKKENPNDILPLAGIKYLLIERCHYSYDEWESCKEIRNGIIHGFKPLESIKKEVTENLPVLEKALQIGIFESIDIPEEQIRELIHLPYPPFSKTEQLCYVMLNDSDKKTLVENGLPDLSVEKIDFKLSGNSNQSNHTISTSHKMNNYTGSYRPIELGLKGSMDPELKNRRFSVTETTVKNESNYSRFKQFIFKLLKKSYW